ncbi:acyl-CoA dehydrogenase NM domain-like protein [Atractiella rhizophila]|nr:acyl-CoA dehydrogenase NM domain-like protein [Atractiella rhizophila]
MSKHPVTKYVPEPAWSLVEDKFSPFAKETLAKLVDFVENECMPAEAVFHDQISTDPATRWKNYPDVIEDLKAKAKKLGLWNLFLSKAHYPDSGVPLTNLEYALMAEIMGRCPRVAPEACNCSAPDTGNMEVFARYGTPAQKQRWLAPLLRGEIRSAFAMTEKGVASSDATNIQTRIEKVGNEIVINGHKWWISGAGDPRCKVHLVMGKNDPKAATYLQQSVVIVPADTPGVKLVRPMKVFNSDDAPEGHFEIIYDNVRVPLDNLVLGWGRGFEIIQGRLGPGRDPKAATYLQQSVVIVPADTPGVKLVRPMKVFNSDDAPEGHFEIIYDNVRVPLDNLVLGWGRGFEIIQGRLGPGRIHHCMRSVGAASRAHELMITRVTDPARKTFGKTLDQHGLIVHRLAESRNDIDQARLLVLSAANEIDKHKSKGALKAIAMAKSVVPLMATNVIDRAIQSFGAEGISQDQILAGLFTGLRTLRFADGPDEVHMQQIGRSELQRAPGLHADMAKTKKQEEALYKAKGLVKSHL